MTQMMILNVFLGCEIASLCVKSVFQSVSWQAWHIDPPLFTKLTTDLYYRLTGVTVPKHMMELLVVWRLANFD